MVNLIEKVEPSEKTPTCYVLTRVRLPGRKAPARLTLNVESNKDAECRNGAGSATLREQPKCSVIFKFILESKVGSPG